MESPVSNSAPIADNELFEFTGSLRVLDSVPQINCPAHVLDCAAPRFHRGMCSDHLHPSGQPHMVILWPCNYVSVTLSKDLYLPFSQIVPCDGNTGERAKQTRMRDVFGHFTLGS